MLELREALCADKTVKHRGILDVDRDMEDLLFVVFLGKSQAGIFVCLCVCTAEKKSKGDIGLTYYLVSYPDCVVRLIFSDGVEGKVPFISLVKRNETDEQFMHGLVRRIQSAILWAEVHLDTYGVYLSSI